MPVRGQWWKGQRRTIVSEDDELCQHVSEVLQSSSTDFSRCRNVTAQQVVLSRLTPCVKRPILGPKGDIEFQDIVNH